MAKTEDYYSILQVSSDASIHDIKASFRRLARQYHPDLNPNDPVAAEKFKLISQAYEVLSDTTARRRYDRDYYNPKSQDHKRSQSPQDYYFKGLQKSQRKEYQQAIRYFTKAIELDSTFIDAYLKRCEMRYKLGDNKGVLEDCRQVLDIDSATAKAYYYQGRARYRLGSTQAAIEAYTQAIKQENNYAQAYYYRGIAYRDLKENLPAIEDFDTAADLFKIQGNHSAYRLTKKNLQGLSKENWQLNEFYSWSSNLFNNVLTTLAIYFFNPGGGLLPAFARLEKQQAMEVGIIYGISADLLFLGGTYSSWEGINFPWLELIVIGLIPFVSLVAIGNLVRNFCRGTGSIETDIFIVGTTIAPLGLMSLIIGLIPLSLSAVLLGFLIYGCCYSVLTLYTGCTQIWNLSEAKSAFLVPLMLLFSSWLFYFAFQAIVIFNN